MDDADVGEDVTGDGEAAAALGDEVGEEEVVVVLVLVVVVVVVLVVVVEEDVEEDAELDISGVVECAMVLLSREKHV